MPGPSGFQWVDPDYNTQTGTVYPLGLDGCLMDLKRIGNSFNPFPQATPNMTIGVDAGHIFNGATLTEVAAQSTPTFTAPVSNPRIDRVVIDHTTGALSVVAGTENASPTPPAIPAGKCPVAQVMLQTTSTAISNTMITDERDLTLLGLASGAVTTVGTAATQNVGTAAGDVVQLDGSAKLPAVDGSQLTNLPIAGTPTRQVLTSGTAATYTTPAGCKLLRIRMVGAGGGASGINGTPALTAGTAGGDTIFNGVHSGGGGAGSATGADVPASGGSSSTGTADFRIAGNVAPAAPYNIGGDIGAAPGAAGPWGGAGKGTGSSSASGGNAAANSGAGGGAAMYSGANQYGSNPGAAGEYVELSISSPAASYTYTVGAAGAGGSTTYSGGNGGSGLIIVDEYY